MMKEPYDATHWQSHLKECATRNLKKKAASNTPILFKMGFLTKSREWDESNSKTRISSPKVPCPGINGAENPKVMNYLKRTAALGGGGCSLADIAKGMFMKSFSTLQSENNQ